VTSRGVKDVGLVGRKMKKEIEGRKPIQRKGCTKKGSKDSLIRVMRSNGYLVKGKVEKL